MGHSHRSSRHSDMFTSLALLAVSLFLCKAYTLRSSDDELRGIRLSKHRNGTETLILRYEAPRPATVLWISRNMHTSTNESFANGQGVSEITSDQRMAGVVFGMPGSSVIYYLGTYMFANKEMIIPRPEIQFNGEEIIYTPGKATDVSVKWTKPPGDPSHSFVWTFIGLDPSVSDEILTMASSKQPGPQSFLSQVETTSIGDMCETSAELLLQDQSGLVIFTFMYESPELSMSVFKILPIRPDGGSVFPDNFLAFMPLGSQIYCFQGRSCQVPCLAIGRNIQSLELRDHEGNSVTSGATYNSEWLYATYYTVPTLSTKQTKTYACVATNSNGLVKENGIQVHHNPF